MNKVFLTKIVRFFIIITVFFIIYLYLIPALKFSSAWGESMYFPYISQTSGVNYNPFWQMFLASDHGWFLYSFVMVFTNRYMPLILNMHHQDYMSQYNIWIILTCYMFFLLSVQFHFEKYFKNKLLSIFAVFFILPVLLIFQAIPYGMWWFAHDCWFYAYILLTVFPVILYTKFEKQFVLNQTLNKRDYFIYFILILLTGVGHEFFKAVVLFSFPIFFFLNNIFLKNKIEFTKFLKIYITTIILNSLVFLTTIPVSWFLEKKRTFIQCINIFVPYMKEYFHTVIMNNIYLLIIITVLSVVGHFITKKSESFKKLNVISYSVLISVLLFNIVIILGKEQYEFSFIHPGVIFLTKLTFLLIILSLSGYIISVTKPKNRIIFILLLASVSAVFSYKKRKYFDITPITNFHKEHKIKLYLTEKMFYLYGKEHKTLYLFDNDMFPQFIIYEYLYKYDDIKNTDNYDVILIENDIKKFRNFITENTGITITNEELENLKFSDITELK